MEELTFVNFLSYLKEWLEKRFESLPNNGYNFYSRGGWEGWAQVELYMYYRGLGCDIIREEHCYNNTHLKVDLLINSQIPANARKIRPLAVEIKCGCTDWTDDNFKKAFLTDKEKLVQNLDNRFARVSLVFAANASQVQLLQDAGYQIITNSYRTMSIGYKLE